MKKFFGLVILTIVATGQAVALSVDCRDIAMIYDNKTAWIIKLNPKLKQLKVINQITSLSGGILGVATYSCSTATAIAFFNQPGHRSQAILKDIISSRIRTIPYNDQPLAVIPYKSELLFVSSILRTNVGKTITDYDMKNNYVDLVAYQLSEPKNGIVNKYSHPISAREWLVGDSLIIYGSRLTQLDLRSGKSKTLYDFSKEPAFPFSGSQLLVANNQIYLVTSTSFKSNNSKIFVSNAIYKFSPSSHKWIKYAMIPNKIATNFVFITAKGTIYLFDKSLINAYGYSSTGWINYKLNLNESPFAIAETSNGQIILVGGKNDISSTKVSVHSYDQNWRQESEIVLDAVSPPYISVSPQYNINNLTAISM